MLKSGVIFATFSDVGKVPFCRLLLIKKVRGAAISLAMSLMILAGIVSIPDDLVDRRILWTSWRVTSLNLKVEFLLLKLHRNFLVSNTFQVQFTMLDFTSREPTLVKNLQKALATINLFDA